jgi:hypothetical protein
LGWGRGFGAGWSLGWDSGLGLDGGVESGWGVGGWRWDSLAERRAAGQGGTGGD